MSVANTRITPQVANSKMVDLNFTVHKNISPDLIEEIARALHSVGGFGSIEIYVQDYSVTQITVRNIRKTKHILAEWRMIVYFVKNPIDKPVINNLY